MGGYERGFGIFVDRVERDSKAAEIGLKRGDQVMRKVRNCLIKYANITAFS